MGCLGFNVVGGRQAKIMVDQYYKTLAEECVPIGHAVNANIAVLATLHCHADAEVAKRNGENLKFFGYTIGKYYLNGSVRPGASGSWDEFLAVKDSFPEMGDSPTSAIGTPEMIREHLRALQAAGVDQVMLMHQAGHLDHEANCRSLELFAREVMPEFVEHEDEREKAKAERLAPAIEAALARKPWMQPLEEVPAVEAYGHFSHLPTAEDYAIEATSSDTAGALGLRYPARRSNGRRRPSALTTACLASGCSAQKAATTATTASSSGSSRPSRPRDCHATSSGLVGPHDPAGGRAIVAP